jgi:hypothetical protein
MKSEPQNECDWVSLARINASTWRRHCALT